MVVQLFPNDEPDLGLACFDLIGKVYVPWHGFHSYDQSWTTKYHALCSVLLKQPSTMMMAQLLDYLSQNTAIFS